MTNEKQKVGKTMLATVQKKFEHAIGKPALEATHQDIENWMHLLRGTGYAVNTCRTYLSLIKGICGLNVPAPRREETIKRSLTNEEIKFMLATAEAKDYAWLASMVLTGSEVINWTFGELYDPTRIVSMPVYLIIVADAQRRGYRTFPYPYRGNLNAHWIGDCHPEGLIWDIPQHEINRRLKSIARRAGIDSRNINVTTLKYTHNRLIERYGTTESAAKALGIAPAQEEPTPARKRDSRMYSIGRRSPAFIDRA